MIHNDTRQQIMLSEAIEANLRGIMRGQPRREQTLTEEQRQKRRKLQCQREEREANREVWE